MWQAGESGNPHGRPKGSRNKLGEDFVRALYDDFEQHGVAVIAVVRESRPQDYLKIVAALVPKQIETDNEGPLVVVIRELGTRVDEMPPAAQ
jgi:hypothetical protein